LLAVLCAAPAAAKPPARAVHAAAHVAAHKKPAPAVPVVHTSPGVPSDEEMKNAVPLDQASKLPPTSVQYGQLQKQIAKNRPAVETARQKSDALTAQAADLRRKLVDTAARVQALEKEKARIDFELVTLVAQEKTLAVQFSRDRVQVAQLLAVLERLQSDMPPVLILKADDALGAARGSMLLGASLPRVYGAAAALSKKLQLLRKTRVELVARRAESTRNALQLGNARVELDQLLAMKSREADEASATYGDLQSKLDSAADEAATLEMLLDKVSSLRNDMPSRGIVVVSAQKPPPGGLAHGSLLAPVVGILVSSGHSGAVAPLGLTFTAQPGAQAIAPADTRVLFAGRYHNQGQVLILEAAGGYDLVLEGLDRIEVKPGDQLLAGEPVGTMPWTGGGSRLYFEVLQNGKSVNPAPLLQVDLRKARRT
jgi:septal ring factor EnvC (AmiA/AmiB activator)